MLKKMSNSPIYSIPTENGEIESNINTEPPNWTQQNFFPGIFYQCEIRLCNIATLTNVNVNCQTSSGYWSSAQRPLLWLCQIAKYTRQSPVAVIWRAWFQSAAFFFVSWGYLGNRHPPPSTPATWGVDSGYPDSGYPTLATPTLATYKGWHRLPIGGETGYLFFSAPLLDKVMFFECLEIYANVIKRIF